MKNKTQAAPAAPVEMTDGSIEAMLPKLLTLTAREYEVMLKLGTGEKTMAVAADLFVSVKTIETHVMRLKQKLGFSDIWALRSMATRFLVYVSANRIVRKSRSLVDNPSFEWVNSDPSPAQKLPFSCVGVASGRIDCSKPNLSAPSPGSVTKRLYEDGVAATVKGVFKRTTVN